MKQIEQIAKEELDFIANHIEVVRDLEMYYTTIQDFESLGYDLTEVKEKHKERIEMFKSMFGYPLSFNEKLNEKWFFKS